MNSELNDQVIELFVDFCRLEMLAGKINENSI